MWVEGYVTLGNEYFLSFMIFYFQADSFSDDKVGQLMTSVSTPVFDRRNRTVSFNFVKNK